MHSNTQHGRQPQPQPAAPPTDPRKRNVPPAATTSADLQGVCRDFVWGICTMGAQCKYRHDLDFESMKAILKFCHDHQNRTGCTRPDCTYLHTSRDEENLFLTTGQIPRVLVDRYEEMAKSSAAAVPPASVAEAVPPVATVPPHMLYDYIVQPPPPPPPPPPGPGSCAPPPMSLSMPTVPAPLSTMPAPVLAPPPPPPPPPTATVTPMRVAGPVYTAPMPPTTQSVANVAVYQPQPQPQSPLPVLFDPSRPPPPLPPASRKRLTQDENEAGPSKLRKSEPNIDSSCESCMQRQLRSKKVIQQIETIEQDNDSQRADIKRKMDEYEKKKMLLKTLLRPESYRIAEECIESVNHTGSMSNTINDLMAVLFNNSRPAVTSPFNSNISATIPLMLQFLTGSNSRSGLRNESPPPEDDMLNALNIRSRPIQDENVMSTLFDFMKNVTEKKPSESRSVEAELNKPSSSGNSNTSNGLDRFLSDSLSPPLPSQNATRYASPRSIEGVAGPSGLTNSRYPEAVAAVSPSPSTRAYEPAANPPVPAPNPYESRPHLENHSVPGNSVPYDGAGPSGAHPYADGLAGGLPRPYADGPARYPPALAAPPRQYHPGLCEGATVPTNAPPMYAPGTYTTPTQPPVVRNYYHFPQNNMSNAAYPGMAPRLPPSGMPTLPQNQQHYQHYMGRYPYYPPF